MAKTALTQPKTSGSRKHQPPASQSQELQPHDIALSSDVQNAAGVQAWGKFAGEIDLSKLVEDLHKQVADVAEGNMRPMETMLFGQAMALQTMFTNLSRRAAANDGLKQFQVNLTLALKAQAQCRATLEALAEIKNPRQVAFVKQANIANGPQQINNGISEQYAHTSKNNIVQNGLLERQDGNHLDTGAQSQAGRVDPRMATVDKGQRSRHA